MVEKLVDYRENMDSNTIISVTVWKVPESQEFPEGIKYKLQAFDVRTEDTILRYDNHNDAHESRHHKHIENRTEKIENPFKNKETPQSILILIEKFEKEVEQIK